MKPDPLLSIGPQGKADFHSPKHGLITRMDAVQLSDPCEVLALQPRPQAYNL